jgi:queuine tRNA-ribosyltransferase
VGLPAEFSFELRYRDAGTNARLGVLHTPHGAVETPAFMPVGTQGTVKGLTPAQIRSTGAQMILGNTYHLALRPGEQVVADLGGLHQFMGWDGPILTDSGGFQIFSLAAMARITEEGATFRSHIDGSLVTLTPERAILIQRALGSDIAMALDHVIQLPAPPELVSEAMQRSLRWAERCLAVGAAEGQVLFGIVQGGLDRELRLACAERLATMDFAGIAMGGLSVGESSADMLRVLDFTVPALPVDKPRYLMGVGRPEDLLAAIERGIDMFDCVIPTRNGRNALAFTKAGPLRLRNVRFQRDNSPLEEGCPCAACGHSRGYLRHLFMAREMLGPVLLSIHNLTYYQRLLAEARQAIAEDRFAKFQADRITGWSMVPPTDEPSRNDPAS